MNTLDGASAWSFVERMQYGYNLSKEQQEVAHTSSKCYSAFEIYIHLKCTFSTAGNLLDALIVLLQNI
jgi:hypothetical protein